MASCSSSNGNTILNSFVDNVQLPEMPDEVLLNILQWLPIQALLVCEKVSQRWQRLALDPFVWRRHVIVFNGRIYENDERRVLNSVLASHSQFICKIKVQYVHSYPTLKSILTTCHGSNLISLELIMCKISKDFEEDLKVWKNLRRLSLRNSISGGNQDLLVPLEQYKDLRFLELSQFGLSHVNCDALIGLNRLSNIHIDKIKDLQKTFIRQLIISKKDILESLHIYGGNQIDDEVLEILSQCPCLKSLSVKYCTYLTDRGLITLTKLKKIRYLQLWNNNDFTEKCLLTVLGHPMIFDINVLSLSRLANVTPEIIEIIHKHYNSLEFLALYSCPKIPEDIDYEIKLKEKFPYLQLIRS